MTAVQFVHPLDVAPCGECGELVLREGGCAHWKPDRALGQAVTAREKRERKQPARRASAAERAAQVADFRAELKRAGLYR